MLSPGAVVLVFLLGSAEGYATVRDDRVFASSLDQQSKNSTASDRDGDMKVSVGVQADASVSELEDDMDGVQTLKAADDRSSLGETELNENAPPKDKKGTPCFELDQNKKKVKNQKGPCKKCEEKKYAGHLGCGFLTTGVGGDVTKPGDCTPSERDCCEDWYEWGLMGRKYICQPKYVQDRDTIGGFEGSGRFTGCSGASVVC